MELRTRALQALCLRDPSAKVAAAQLLQQQAATLSIAKNDFTAFGAPPGRPDRPQLVERVTKPQRSPFTPDGLATLLHTVAHIEFNAIKNAPDAELIHSDSMFDETTSTANGCFGPIAAGHAVEFKWTEWSSVTGSIPNKGRNGRRFWS